MTVSTVLSPNATGSGGTYWTVTGAATAWEALADASDSSYITQNNTIYSGPVDDLSVNLSTATPAALVTSLTLSIRHSYVGSQNGTELYDLWVEDSAADFWYYPGGQFTASSSATTQTHTFYPSSGHKPLTQARLDSLRVRFSRGSADFGSTVKWRIYEFSVTVNTEPEGVGAVPVVI